MENTETSIELTPQEKVKALLKKATKPNTFLGLKTTEIQAILEGIKIQVQNALPSHLTPERMIQVATSCIAKNPFIQECTPGSIMGAVVSASILGLNFALGEAYLVPYGKKGKNEKGEDYWYKECQMQVGYRGFVKLARQSGEIKSISAHVVRKGDTFNFSYGLYEVLEHIPLADETAEITHVYAVAHYKDGGYNTVVLTKGQIEALRKRSPNQKETPSMAWATDYPAMACAKAIKQLERWMPKSDTLTIASRTDESVIDIQAIKKGEINVEELEYPNADFTDIQDENLFVNQAEYEKQAKEKKK